MGRKLDSQSDSKESKSHTVSSSSSRSPKTVSFNVPTIPKPDFQAIRKIDFGRWRAGIIVGLFILVAVFSGFIGAWFDTRNNSGLTSSATVSNEKKIVTSNSQLISQIANTVGPSVVSVNVNITAGGGSSTQQSGGFGLYGFTQPENEQAAGTQLRYSISEN
jgi:hypothetical protein